MLHWIIFVFSFIPKLVSYLYSFRLSRCYRVHIIDSIIITYQLEPSLSCPLRLLFGSVETPRIEAPLPIASDVRQKLQNSKFYASVDRYISIEGYLFSCRAILTQAGQRVFEAFYSRLAESLEACHL